MNFKGVFLLSLLTQLKQMYAGPVLFAWILVMLKVLAIQIDVIITLFIGCILVVYQQFQAIQEDRLEGFFEYSLNNGICLWQYVLAKSFAQIITSILPLVLISYINFQNYLYCLLFGIQWIVINYLICAFACIDRQLVSLQLLLVGLPMLTGPVIFLTSLSNAATQSNLYLFIGCNVILISVISALLLVNSLKKNHSLQS
jgi:hypothetical protein